MSTATQTTQTPQTFKERIKGMSKNELTEIAKDEFQLSVDDRVLVDVLRDTLQRVHEERKTTAMEINQAASQLFLERDKDEKLLTVIFLPLDFPNAPCKFSYDGGYGVRNRKNPKRNPNGLSKMANFFLIPGEQYQLPLCVINHLQGKTYRDNKPQFDSKSGMQNGNIPIIKPRFMLNPVLSDEAMKDLGSRKFN
jgi:hypothetical protein